MTKEEYRRQQSRELNKGEASHDLSRFLFFGKEGALRGRGFDDQFRSFSCLGVLHNAVVAWNIKRSGQLVEQLRAEGHVIDDVIDDATLSQTTPLMRKHLNPFGRYHFDLDQMRRTGPSADGRWTVACGTHWRNVVGGANSTRCSAFQWTDRLAQI